MEIEENVPEQERSCLLLGVPHNSNDKYLQEMFLKEGQKIVSIKSKMMGSQLKKMIVKEGNATFMK